MVLWIHFGHKQKLLRECLYETLHDCVYSMQACVCICVCVLCIQLTYGCVIGAIR